MDDLAQLLQRSKYTIIFTGAGMSTESGIPDFRSATQGIWNNKNPMLLASTYALEHNRSEFEEFYRMRIDSLLQCRPNKGHEVLSEWEDKGLIQGIITQNVDGFHQMAGSKKVYELHGSINQLACLSCNKEYSGKKYLEDDGALCECGGFLRPTVVLFGEELPKEAVQQADKEVDKADLFIVLV